SVRESFHLLHYLARQDVPRELFEVIVVEYYSTESAAIRKFEAEVDTWLLLEMPEECYYHKHLMYNAGIVLARGEICVICDSDAMVKPTFIRSIMESFAREPELVLHLDQFRNNRRDLYPFAYPSFGEVQGEGCINNAGGKPAGILDAADPIHSRNYGACMCARREALIGIGGADEHVDFLGHICGPYDMTWRLVNSGRREHWHQSEFMYHTWHPGQAGVDNYLGPHDGRHVSTTSLAALASGRIAPLLENAAIRKLREGSDEELLESLIRTESRTEWLKSHADSGSLERRVDSRDLHVDTYRGFLVYRDAHGYYAHLALDPHRGRGGRYTKCVEGNDLPALRAAVDAATPAKAALGLRLARLFVPAWLAVGHLGRRAGRALRRFAARGTAAAGPGVPPGARVRQFVSESGQIGDALGDLAQNLCFLPEAVTVVADSPRTIFFLRMLKALGIARRATLVHVRNAEQVVEILKGNHSNVVVTRQLFWRCTAMLGSRLTDERLVVV
ncbi:MAG TPA: glycosyltransferase family 2 protein, partial [Burkholderiales bacterium]|nr:glycosyltransferase family 2 protein [Burkholderiales bacterium]